MNNTHGLHNKIENILESTEHTETAKSTSTPINASEGIDRDKWLLFVDDKNLGKELAKQLGKEKVVFISAENKRDRDQSDTVSEIVVNEKSNKQYLIATSVLDNGINLKDCQLRNIILMADTEMEFIQMLGRKRKDGEKVNLYIYQHNKKHFQERLRSAEKRLNIASKYVIYMKNCKEKYYQNFEEDRAIKHLQIYFMRQRADEKIAVEDVRSLFNVYGGVFYLNLLAVHNLKNLKKFYNMVIDEFDKIGEDAFVKIQLGWLGIDEEIIKESKLTQEERCCKQVNDWMEEISNDEMSRDEFIQKLKSINKQISFLAKATKAKEGFDEKTVNNITKSDRPLTDEHIEYLNKFYEIPYIINKKIVHIQLSKNRKLEIVGLLHD